MRINEFKDLGKIIQETRKQQALTQAQLSAACGVGERFIHEVEKGKNTCQIGKVIHVLKMLGIDLMVSKKGED